MLQPLVKRHVISDNGLMRFAQALQNNYCLYGEVCQSVNHCNKRKTYCNCNYERENDFFELPKYSQASASMSLNKLLV